MSLHDVIMQIRSGAGNRELRLLIHGPADDLRFSTDCVLSPVDVDEDSEGLEEIIPQEFADRGLRSTIEYEAVKGCIEYGDRLAGRPDDEAAAEIIRYYLRFDSVPEKLGASDPPGPETIQARVDREFLNRSERRGLILIVGLPVVREGRWNSVPFVRATISGR